MLFAGTIQPRPLSAHDSGWRSRGLRNSDRTGRGGIAASASGAPRDVLMLPARSEHQHDPRPEAVDRRGDRDRPPRLDFDGNGALDSTSCGNHAEAGGSLGRPGQTFRDAGIRPSRVPSTSSSGPSTMRAAAAKGLDAARKSMEILKRHRRQAAGGAAGRVRHDRPIDPLYGWPSGTGSSWSWATRWGSFPEVEVWGFSQHARPAR